MRTHLVRSARLLSRWSRCPDDTFFSLPNANQVNSPQNAPASSNCSECSPAIGSTASSAGRTTSTKSQQRSTTPTSPSTPSTSLASTKPGSSFLLDCHIIYCTCTQQRLTGQVYLRFMTFACSLVILDRLVSLIVISLDRKRKFLIRTI